MNTADHLPLPPRERIEAVGLVLRRWTDMDADLHLEAVTASFDHLHPWMPWAAKPPSLSDEQVYLNTAAQRWSAREAFEYAILDAAESQLLGGIGLHDRVGPGGWDIGYWVHIAHTGHGVATTAAAALTDVAFSLPATERVEIHCDEANTASAAVPRRLGYRLAYVRGHRQTAPAESGKRMIWVMSRAVYPGSDAEQRAHAGR